MSHLAAMESGEDTTEDQVPSALYISNRKGSDAELVGELRSAKRLPKRDRKRHRPLFTFVIVKDTLTNLWGS